MTKSPQTTQELPDGVMIHGPLRARYDEILTGDALRFLAALHRALEPARRQLLAARGKKQQEWDQGGLPGFLPETRHIRDDPDWRVAAIPAGLKDRRVEITGPVERKMMINALNCGARVFMADFEDSNSPTWDNNVQGQLNLLDHTNHRLAHKDPASGKEYEVGDDPAKLVVRVRGLHLDEGHVTVDGEGVSGALFDFALHFHHNAKPLSERGQGPWYYVPKLEHHLEARFWNQVFNAAQNALGLETGTIKATCLIETFPAVFQMHEILWELRDHAAGLNAGRWDYIFSAIKTCGRHPDKVLPDRAQITMAVPFMRAYSQLLIKTCHERGAFAMGGMSAFIPNRRDPDVTKQALAAVRADKKREAADGCDGTWVAHPDLVPIALQEFDDHLGQKVNQLERRRDDVSVTEDELLDLLVPGGKTTRSGLRNNLEVALVYLESWLRGTGAVAIHNLMEDAATAEISRSQVWQWIEHETPLEDGTPVTRELVSTLMDELLDGLKAHGGPHRFDDAARLLRRVALSDDFPAFLTLPAYPVLTQENPP